MGAPKGGHYDDIGTIWGPRNHQTHVMWSSVYWLVFCFFLLSFHILSGWSVCMVKGHKEHHRHHMNMRSLPPTTTREMQGLVGFHSTPPTEGVESTSWNSVCLSVCLSVRHHFNISNLGPSNHRRIMLDPTHYASLERRWHQGWQWQWQRHTQRQIQIQRRRQGQWQRQNA